MFVILDTTDDQDLQFNTGIDGIYGLGPRGLPKLQGSRKAFRFAPGNAERLSIRFVRPKQPLSVGEPEQNTEKDDSFTKAP